MIKLSMNQACRDFGVYCGELTCELAEQGRHVPGRSNFAAQGRLDVDRQG